MSRQARQGPSAKEHLPKQKDHEAESLYPLLNQLRQYSSCCNYYGRISGRSRRYSTGLPLRADLLRYATEAVERYRRGARGMDGV